MNIGQTLNILAQRLLNTTGVWTPEETLPPRAISPQLTMDDDVVVLSSPPVSIPGVGRSPRLIPWGREVSALTPPSARTSLSSSTSSISSDGSDDDFAALESLSLSRASSHSEETPASPLNVSRLSPPRMSLPGPIMPVVASATFEAERRGLVQRLSEPYARLVCQVDAICVMGNRHTNGLPTESPERLGQVILSTAERLGVVRAMDSIRAQALSLQTLRDRVELLTSDTFAAEEEFVLSFA